MIVEPKFRGFICTTSHPTGCKKNVENQIEYVKENGKIEGAKRVLVLGASTGYGLASAIVASESCDAEVLGVSFEREAKGKRTASAGWYNIESLKKFAEGEGKKFISVNGDAFSNEVKSEVIDLIKENMGKVDLVIYSLAAPKRKDPVSGEVYSSCLKTVGAPFTSKTLDFHTGEIQDITINPATEEEIEGTRKVMGGEDWMLWIEALKEANVLENGVKTIAYSYIGPEVTYPIYREGTIGRAKNDLEKTAGEITKVLKSLDGEGYISVNKALVTQASSAIPIVSLYISILYKVMKEKGTHEGCIEQIYRMFKELYEGNLNLDSENRIRIDDLEMAEDVQKAIEEIWPQITSENVFELSDAEDFKKEFFKLFGFGLEGVDYSEDVDITTV